MNITLYVRTSTRILTARIGKEVVSMQTAYSIYDVMLLLLLLFQFPVVFIFSVCNKKIKYWNFSRPLTSINGQTEQNSKLHGNL